MYIRKITQIMLWILGVLILLILIKGIQNIMSSINVSNDEEEIVYEKEEFVDIVEGGAYDETDMFFEGFENVYGYFNSIKEAIDCENVLKASLVDYGTPIRTWKVENILLDGTTLSFEIISKEKIDESYEITISDKDTIIERIR